jgi:hypothetical protein
MIKNRLAKSELQTRTLIYIPIIHTQADMGALKDHVKNASLKKLGLSGWKRKVSLVDKYWTEIEKIIDGLSVPPDRIRIYQDALPVSGRELVIIEELAKSGSRNHALLLKLIGNGATAMGTESLELLLEEYNHVKRTLGAETGSASEDEKSAGETILRRRDKFIAERINETLLAGEVGILFLGMLHSLEQWLERDIQVTYPIHTPFGAGAIRPDRQNPAER